MKKVSRRGKFYRIATVLLAIVMLLSITACSGNSGVSDSDTPSDSPTITPSASASSSPTLNPGAGASSSPTLNPGIAPSPSEEIVVPPDLALTAGGTVIAGNPASGSYTTMSVKGPVYVQEFEPTYVQPKTPGTVWIYTNPIVGNDPALAAQVEYGWCTNVYEPLFQKSPDGTGEFVPVLATDWYYDDQGDFHAILREGVKFHDGAGRIMTAEDVLYSVGRVVSLTQSPAHNGMQGVDMENSYAESDYHVVFKFTSPVGGFMNYMASSWLSIVNKEFFEEVGPDYDFLEKSAGTGAYYLVETVTGISQTFKRFDDYWGGKPVMDTINIRRGDTTVMGIDLENGDFDIAMQSTVDSVSRVLDGTVKGLDYLILSTHRSFRFQPALLPVTKPFADFRVREAFSLSINREDLIIAIYGTPDFANVADRQMHDGISFGPLEYNPDRAREIMSGLGYSASNPLTVEIITSTTQESEICLEAVQAMANECYFDVIPVTVTASIDAVNNSRDFPFEWDGAITQAQGWIDAEIYFMDIDAYQKDVGEFSGLKANDDPEFARLFRQLPITIDQTERQKIIDALNTLYHENLYYIPLSIGTQPTLVQDYLQNVTFRDGLGIVWKDLQYKDWVDYTP